MTIVGLRGEKLLLHSPVPITTGLLADIEPLGEVRAIVAPSRYHHLHVRSASEAFPRARVYGAPGLAKKRKDLKLDGVLEEEAPEDWAGDLEQTMVGGIPILSEFAFFHPASHSLILTDLCFNYPATGSGVPRLYRKLAGVDGKFAVELCVRLFVRDRKALRSSCDRIIEWDFDRVVVAHGEVLESGGKEAFKRAFAWLD